MDEIFIILLLIVLNGVFSMSEIAIISARKTTLTNQKKRGSRGAKTALNLAEHPDKFLSTVQIGITLIGILTGIFSGAELSADFSSLLSSAGLPVDVAKPLAQFTIIIGVTFLTIVFGELVPKRIGMSIAERVSVMVSRPMLWISRLASPFVWTLSKSTETIVALLGLKGQESKVTEEDIKTMVEEGREDGSVEDVEQDIVERVFMLGDLHVDQLMTHRSDVCALDVNMSCPEVKETIHEHLFGSYPVIEGDNDHVIGMG